MSNFQYFIDFSLTSLPLYYNDNSQFRNKNSTIVELNVDNHFILFSSTFLTAKHLLVKLFSDKKLIFYTILFIRVAY